MSEIIINDFSAGWCPGDDPIKGRKNGLLQMDNMELDATGALNLAGGTLVSLSGFTSNAHTLYNRLINGAVRTYSALADGTIYRDTTQLAASGGDSTNAGFGTAFKYTLICSGTKHLKDDGSSAVNLGILPPTLAPVTTQSSLNAPYVSIGAVDANTVTPFGSSAVVSTYLQMTANITGTCVVQTYLGAGAPHNTMLLQGVGGASNIGNGLDTDVLTLQGYMVNPFGETLQVDALLVAGDLAGDVVSDYYTVTLNISDLIFDPTSGVWTAKILRNEFTRVGAGAQDWTAVYGFRLTLRGAPLQVLNVFGAYNGNTSILFYGGDKCQQGQYQYVQVNVNNTGSYIAKSVIGPASNLITVLDNQVLVTPQDPTGVDAQCNEAWIYRRGGNLDQWYRVLVFIAGTFATPKYDILSDQDALTLNITINLNILSISSLPDKVYDILGPINGRWYYFTEQFMYPSEINNPDSYDPSVGIRICGSNSELFMWARQVSDSQVLVGTSVDVYSLSGTFASFPDGSIDIYYRSTKCRYPPLTCDAEVYGGNVYYLANDGWRVINGSGQAAFTGNSNPSLVSPNLDRLYRGESVSGYTALSLKIVPRSNRFPIVIAKNKMWCFITTASRIEVYDFIRQYWRVVTYGLGDVSAAIHSQDGQVLAFFKNDKKIRTIDYQTSKLIDGVTNQAVSLKFLVQDGQMPRQRKDSQTFKARLQASGNVTFNLIVDGSATVNAVGTFVSAGIVTDNFSDLSSISNVALVKTYQVSVSGSIADFILEDISILFEPRPVQTTFLRILNTNFGSAARKRVRTLPLVIDTLGNNVTWTPSVDNTNQSTTTLNTTHKDTKLTFYKTDVSGIDYGGILSSTGLFEFYELGQPEIVQVFPVAKQFDQIGPEEFFRYGKVIKIEFRLLPVGGTTIPYTLYFNDTSNLTGNLTVVSNVDAAYFLTVPKGTSGQVMRLELGPTSFNFHRFYTRLLVSQSGQESDDKWINI